VEDGGRGWKGVEEVCRRLKRGHGCEKEIGITRGKEREREGKREKERESEILLNLPLGVDCRVPSISGCDKCVCVC
jgi:hypothetical protein